MWAARKGRATVTGYAEGHASGPGRLAYPVTEAAEWLGVGKTYMFHLIAVREIDSVRIGRVRRIPRAALISYMRRLHPDQAVTAVEPGPAWLFWHPVQEAADLLGISRAFMYRLVAAGDISSARIGRRRAIPHDVLVDYIEQLQAEQSACTQHPRMLPPASRSGYTDRSGLWSAAPLHCTTGISRGNAKA